MKILFTKSDSLLSKIIRGITKEGSSHTAIDTGLVIVHSNLLGINLEWTRFFKRKCVIVHTLERVTPSIDKDMARLDETLTAQEHTPYDFGALLFNGLALLAKRLVGSPMPKVNLWQTTGMHMCTEFVEEVVSMENDAMITPEGLYNKLKASGEWKDADG